MERAGCLAKLRATLVAVARRRASEEAARAGWPLPDALALHLSLYALGLVPPTLPGDDERLLP